MRDFDRCWPYLEAAANRYRDYYRKDDIARLVNEGAQTLVPLPHGAMLWNRRVYPTGLHVLNLWLAGGNLNEITEMVPVLEKRSGCHVSEIYGRRGWLRVLRGYREDGTRMSKAL